MRQILRSTVCAAAFGLCSPVSADDAPSAAHIGTALSGDLPTWWQVSGVEIHASVNDGDEITPRYRQRFTADVTAREELYRRVDEIAPFTVIAPSAAAGAEHRLYGVAASVLELGQWSTEISLENSVAGLGMPRPMFAAPAVIAGSEDSQAAVDSFMLGREIAKTLAERSAAAAASAEMLAALHEQAAAQERELIAEIHRRRAAAIKARIEADFGELDSAVDRLIADNRDTLAELEVLSKQRIAAAEARAETLLAIAETEKEIAAQDDLAAALEELSAKIERTSELETAGMTARIAAEKKRFDTLRTGLASEDPSERIAAFEQALASGDENLRGIALTAAFRSGDDDLEGAALAAFIAGLPVFTLTVSETGNNEMPVYQQSLRVLNAEGSGFTGELTTSLWRETGKVKGTVQGDALFFNAFFKNNIGQGRYTWSARINGAEGALRGPVECSWKGERAAKNPGGLGAVIF